MGTCNGNTKLTACWSFLLYSPPFFYSAFIPYTLYDQF